MFLQVRASSEDYVGKFMSAYFKMISIPKFGRQIWIISCGICIYFIEEFIKTYFMNNQYPTNDKSDGKHPNFNCIKARI